MRSPLLVSAFVDIEEDRAGNMLVQVFLVRVPVLGRHVPGGIDDDKVRRIESRASSSVSVSQVFVCSKASLQVSN